MLQIRLYKNCILNESYQNVFSLGTRTGQMKNVLERYLESLQSIEFDINNAYYENSGELVIDFTENLNPYDYNYMKIVDIDIGLLRYCFINKIEIKNSCVYITYKEDVWSSYSNKINGILPSYLSNTRVKNYSSFTPKLLELPVKYDGNNELIMEPLLNDTETIGQSTIDYVVCLIELQFYKLVSGSDSKSVGGVRYVIAKRLSNDTYKCSLLEAYSTAKMFIEGMPTVQLPWDNGSYYEVSNVYILPASCYDDLMTMFDDTDIRITFPGDIFGYYRYVRNTRSLWNGFTLYEGIIENNYKNLLIGTYDKPLEIINNGTNVNYKIDLFIFSNCISIKLNILNQIIDITDSFKYDIPFTTVLASEYAQRKTSYMLEKMTQESQINYGRYYDLYENLGNLVSFGSYMKGHFSNLTSSLSNMVGRNLLYGYDLENLKLESITVPKYSNVKGIKGNSTSFCNFTGGIFLWKINSDNDDYVKKSIDNFGFKTYEFIEDFNKLDINNVDYWRNNNISFNCIKFETINVYGSFPRDIALELNNLLQNGIKIWFTPSMEQDNYEI